MSYVLTLALDAASQAHFQALRQRWFPPERNHIAAHVTLFHTLPEEQWIADTLNTAADAAEPINLGIPTPRSIGRGVAFFFDSTETVALHRHLRNAFETVVTPQDEQGFRPHIVVMNKATTDEAKVCLAAMQNEKLPATITATGLDLWRYLGGPWEHLQHLPFHGTDDPTQDLSS